jgi:hypothetical protein
MSVFYRFIATKTTYASTIPSTVQGFADLVYRVRKALLATSYPLRVGRFEDYPLPKAIPNMLLCDGSEIPIASFPELYAYLGDSQGAPVDPLNFKLPNCVGVSTPAPVYPTQVVTGGDVNTGGVITEPTQPGQTGGVAGGNPPSGGRPPATPINRLPD